MKNQGNGNSRKPAKLWSRIRKKRPTQGKKMDQIQSKLWGIQFSLRQLSHQYRESTSPDLRILQMALEAHNGEK